MAQTKKQRFRAEKRMKKKPAPPPAPPAKKRTASSAAAVPEENGTKQKLIIGGVIATLLAGVVTTVILVANPFAPAAPPPVAAPQTTAPSTPVGSNPVESGPMDASLARITLIREYRIAVDPQVAQQISDSCGSGEPVATSGRMRGQPMDITVTCEGTTFKVVDSATGAEIANENVAR